MPAINVFGLTACVLLFPPRRPGATPYVLVMVALFVLVLGSLMAFRYRGIDREARRNGTRSQDTVLFARAVLLGQAETDSARVAGGGWLRLRGGGAEAWEAGAAGARALVSG